MGPPLMSSWWLPGGDGWVDTGARTCVDGHVRDDKRDGTCAELGHHLLQGALEDAGDAHPCQVERVYEERRLEDHSNGRLHEDEAGRDDRSGAGKVGEVHHSRISAATHQQEVMGRSKQVKR